MSKKSRYQRHIDQVVERVFASPPRAESEITDDLIELDLALRGLEWAVVNLRESLMDVVSGLVRNLQKGDEADE